MTLSKTERSENIELALKLMMDELGDNAIDESWYEIDKPPYENIYSTTWQYLQDRYWIAGRNTMGSKRCQLTSSGWLEGLRITGLLEAEETKQMVGKLMAELKRSVDGRQDEGLVDIHRIVTDAGVPFGFVFNVIDSNYVDRVLGRKGALWHPQAHGQLIKVPLDLGLEPL
jgi:hypothetical protein